MRKPWVMLLAGACLAGCSLVGARPTPLPWVPTEATVATAESQSAPTAIPAGPTSAPTDEPPITPTEGAAAIPTSAPDPTTTPTSPPSTEQPAGQIISLEIPVAGQSVGNPLTVRGNTRLYPFEGTLVIRVYDARGQLAADVPIIAEGEYGQTASFAASISYGGMPGAGRVEVLEFSPRDDSVTAIATQPVTLSGFPGAGYIELPAPLTQVTLPIGVLARIGTPGQQVHASVVWADGTRITTTHTLLPGLDGKGLLATPLDSSSTAPVQPGSQVAAIEISTLEGSPLAHQPITILHPQHPEGNPRGATPPASDFCAPLGFEADIDRACGPLHNDLK